MSSDLSQFVTPAPKTPTQQRLEAGELGVHAIQRASHGPHGVSGDDELVVVLVHQHLHVGVQGPHLCCQTRALGYQVCESCGPEQALEGGFGVWGPGRSLSGLP